MKKLFLLIGFLGFISTSNAQNPDYCTAGANSQYEYIYAVLCGSLNNVTENSPAPHYTYYSNLTIPMIVGSTPQQVNIKALCVGDVDGSYVP